MQVKNILTVFFFFTSSLWAYAPLSFSPQNKHFFLSVNIFIIMFQQMYALCILGAACFSHSMLRLGVSVFNITQKHIADCSV